MTEWTLTTSEAQNHSLKASRMVHKEASKMDLSQTYVHNCNVWARSSYCGIRPGASKENYLSLIVLRNFLGVSWMGLNSLNMQHIAGGTGRVRSSLFYDMFFTRPTASAVIRSWKSNIDMSPEMFGSLFKRVCLWM